MNHQDVTVSNMQWVAPLIKVHQIGTQEENGGSTIAYADPTHIRMIRRGVSRATLPGKETSGEWLDCTVLHLANGDSLCVTESPETVARLRDSAFGHRGEDRPLSVVSEN